MRRLFWALLLVACVVIPAGYFRAPNLTDYAQETPVFRPEKFFNGTLSNWGMVRDWSGKVDRRFSMTQTDHWEGNHGTLDEAFTFADGATAQRHWTITKTGPTTYIGRAPDVVGDAVGEARGNALHWVYAIRVPRGKDTITVTFDDWLYLVDEQTLFSFVRIRKFGLPVGEMTMVFRKEHP